MATTDREKEEKEINALIKGCKEDGTQKKKKENRRQQAIRNLLNTYIGGNDNLPGILFNLEKVDMMQDSVCEDIFKAPIKGKQNTKSRKN